jgi:hypothetical protein
MLLSFYFMTLGLKKISGGSIYSCKINGRRTELIGKQVQSLYGLAAVNEEFTEAVYNTVTNH